MKERIAEFIRERAYRPMTFTELATAMNMTEKQHAQLQKTLQQMESTGEVVLTRTERYGAPERMNLAVGRLQGHPKGFGFLVPDEPGADDVFIGRESLNGAWHGDRIVARLNPPTRAGGRAEGEVIRILQRGNARVVGTFEAAKNAGYVTPDDRRLADDIFIPKGATNGAKSGEKVVVQIVEWPEARRNAEGRVVERIGMKGQVGVDIVSVIRKFGLPEVFPPRVLKEAEEISDIVQPEAAAEEGRRDLRDWTIVTIDGEDAKDLDDAVNVEKIGPDLWRLGVHIADVSYYVREGSALDQEAYKRATSVYLADRVVPMLPPKLSNGICSLNPQVDRLTLSCVMEINGAGEVLRYDIFPSVINTAARMTYTKVNEILAGEPETVAEYQSLEPMFREMMHLMGILREKRGRRGALDFDLPEAKVKLNSQGWPTEILRINRGISERIIEEFMLAANETVAEHCFRRAVPFMYRIHGEPAGDRVAGLRDFLALFGYNLKLAKDGAVTPKVLQGITDWARGRPEENLINSVLLRTMRQAVYSESNLGHFGLAADYYCHFTSPIRRYPDLVVHRVLRAMLSDQLTPRLKGKWERWMPEAAKQSSDQERVAVEAERETVELKKAEFMSDKVGETFEGIISGVSQFGFFVQLPNTVEGLVHVSNLTDDYYHFHDKFYALIGERNRRRFRLGDAVTVRLNRVDVDTRQIDFAVDMAATNVETVLEVPGETRARAAKKRALMGMPVERVMEAAPPQGEKGGRKRKRRKGKKGRTGEATLLEAPQQPRQQQAVEFGTLPPTPERKGRAKAPRREQTAAHEPGVEAEIPREQEESGRSQVESNPVKRTETGPGRIETARKQTEAGPRRAEGGPRRTEGGPTKRAEGGRGPVGETGRRTEKAPARTGQTAAARLRMEAAPAPRRTGSLDMWGVPVPAGRAARPTRIDDDPGVKNPFSIQAPRNEGRRRKAVAEAPSAPAPATADESAGLPAVPDAPGARKPRARRPARPRTEKQPDAE